jgi:membrane dipeptidase
LPKNSTLKNLFLIFILVALIAGCNTTNESFTDKAKRIHEEVFTVDSHTDSPWYLLEGGFDMNERHDFNKGGSRLDFPRMKEGGLDAVFFGAFVGQRERNEEGNRKAKERVMATIDSILIHLDDWKETAGLALTPDDAYQLEKERKRAIFIGIENGYALGNEISNIELFYQKGARYITLCHTKNNDICDSSTDSTEYGGISTFGIQVVKEMNRCGMMIDVSHISDSSFYQVLRLTEVPVIASHSCARAICDNPRNLDDNMLRALAGNGGVIQMCILSDYVKKPEPFPARDSAFQALHDKYNNFVNLTPEMEKKAWTEWDSLDILYPRKLATISDAVDHIDHIVKIAGIDHVGIGTDFDGGGGLEDCKDVSQLGGITLELVKRGYSEKDIRKLWGGNLMRVMREVQDFKQKKSLTMQ